MKKLIFPFLLFVLLVLLYSFPQDENIQKIKSGEAELICYINNEHKIIDPNKLVGFDDERGYYIFVNGYAKNCVIYDKK